MSNTKDKIIQAAIQQFADNGYTKTTIKNIAKQVGINQSSIYNHFSSKQAILEYVLAMYFEKTSEKIAGLEEVEQLIEHEDAGNILHKMFFAFEPEERDVYLQILKIILHEQFREPLAKQFVKDRLFKQNFEYIKAVLDKLVQAGKIAPVDTGVYAKNFAAINLSASVETMFYAPGERQYTGRVKHTDVINYLINQLTKKS